MTGLWSASQLAGFVYKELDSVVTMWIEIGKRQDGSRMQ